MKLISFDQSGFPALAVVQESAEGSNVLPVTSWAAAEDMTCAVSMRDVLQDWTYWKGRLSELAAEAKPEDWLSAAEVDILAPVPSPGSLIGIGLNYEDHAAETGSPRPPEPVIFAKHPSCVVGPESDIILPNSSHEVDYEAELAIVIGQPAFQADDNEARNAIAGYTIMNDVTARDWQNRTSQWMAAKSFPSFGPMGPLMVTADELGCAENLKISLSVNATPRQDSATSQMIFGVVDIVRHVSSIWPLAPGDVITTGTPAGVGFTRHPASFLRAGDLVEISIEGIGVLRNQVITADGIREGKAPQTSKRSSKTLHALGQR
ncbi:fumarylacetoacetate hydrolase family protein [Arthrobacter globiformis]|uniref:fumarylacetoacetate hydrolase family protein n=1 Tax=Arthrobacter globiformis TaxID=1665 RepID=UPI000B415C0B|nr:fumarylacetoacetate hydrolase family protein [Arthrobacter globiformis]